MRGATSPTGNRLGRLPLRGRESVSFCPAGQTLRGKARSHLAVETVRPDFESWMEKAASMRATDASRVSRRYRLIDTARRASNADAGRPIGRQAGALRRQRDIDDGPARSGKVVRNDRPGVGRGKAAEA